MRESVLRRCEEAVVQYYLTSGDFNGLPAIGLAETLGCDNRKMDRILARLIVKRGVSLTFGRRHPNPHVKAFAPEAEDRQLAKLTAHGCANACIYPSPERLREVVDPGAFEGKPFTLKLALGMPQLTLLSFRLSILEIYRNDPRFQYTTNDIGGQIYAQGEVPESDRIFLQTFGFSFNENMNRAVTVFVRYLADLTSEHQLIWSAHLLDSEYKCHPDYWRSSIGAIPKGISVFQAFLKELNEINEICRTIGYPELFRRVFNGDERPTRFGFLLRPTRHEFDAFVSLLDRLMSDNLNRAFFENDLATTEEIRRRDGRVQVQDKGTIVLLKEWFEHLYEPNAAEVIENIVTAFRDVRRRRQRPAHAIDADEFDEAYEREQRELMKRSLAAVEAIRYILSTHPGASSYSPKYRREEWTVWDC